MKRPESLFILFNEGKNMIKVDFKSDKEEPENRPPYPYIAIGKRSLTFVLFTAPGSGVVLHDLSYPDPVLPGTVYVDGINEMGEFKVYHGKVTLENSL
jgi:hypothetical protein